MAALSAKNFLAPLQNKMQLGTIIIVAVLVALFRVSGGTFTSAARSNRDRDYDYQAVEPESVQRSVPRPEKSRPERIRPSVKPDDDPLADLLKDPEPRAPQNPAVPTSNNLSDVRKALGLE